jgi:phosphate transport system permease protein
VGTVRSAGGGLLRARRLFWDRLVVGLCYLSAVLVILPLGLILAHLLAKGVSGLNLAFFTQMPKPVGELGGGMANAIVGTLIIVGVGALFAIPLGVAAGVYLAEFGRNKFAGIVRYTTDLLSGVPSIVVGVAAYGLVVMPMGRSLPGKSRSRSSCCRRSSARPGSWCAWCRSPTAMPLALGAPRWR